MTLEQLSPRESVLARANDPELRLVRFLYCDYGGIVRGKVTHASHLSQRMDEGIALVRGQIAMNALDALQPVPGMTAVGEVRLVPDPDSFAVLPYVPRTGSMMCDLLTLDREPWAACPRAFLRRTIERAAARGMRIEAAFENEFYLARENEGHYVPFDDSLCFSTAGMDSTATFMDTLIDALDAQGILLEQALPEYGPGQQEISIRHAQAMRAADNQIRVRETARAVAAQHGAIASFAPKPFPDLIGSGAHCHLSLWDTSTGSNLFFDPMGDACFSAVGRHFVGGILDHLPALAAICCPTVNSYRRLQPHAWASAFICWGFDNREASVRVPSPFWGREQATTNIELKTVDNACNPYLALGAIIASGLDGIERALDPGPPLDSDPGRMPADERVHRGIQQLPSSLDEALDNLDADDVLIAELGETLAEAYIQVRRSEVDAYREQSAEFEFAHHFRKY